MDELKQVIVVRQDLRLPKGKMSAQVAHASVEAVLRSDKDVVKRWRAEGQKKIVLKTAGEKELMKLNLQAKEMGLRSAVITDAGRTCIAPGTTTCVGIGPDLEQKVDKLTGDLKMV
jgi:PTH2 family peptidyl-tRNA hydrolase